MAALITSDLVRRNKRFRDVSRLPVCFPSEGINRNSIIIIMSRLVRIVARKGQEGISTGRGRETGQGRGGKRLLSQRKTRTTGRWNATRVSPRQGRRCKIQLIPWYCKIPKRWDIWLAQIKTKNSRCKWVVNSQFPNFRLAALQETDLSCLSGPRDSKIHPI